MVENNKLKRLLNHRCVCVRVHGSRGSGGKAIHSLMIGRLTGKNTGPPIASDEPGTHHRSELISMCAGEKQRLLKEVCPSQLENSCDNVSPLELQALNIYNSDSWSSILFRKTCASSAQHSSTPLPTVSRIRMRMLKKGEGIRTGLVYLSRMLSLLGRFDF